jgi:hypothetical protein
MELLGEFLFSHEGHAMEFTTTEELPETCRDYRRYYRRPAPVEGEPPDDPAEDERLIAAALEVPPAE